MQDGRFVSLHRHSAVRVTEKFYTMTILGMKVTMPTMRRTSQMVREVFLEAR
jgi:hypothetical protein